ncbi:MAG: hypothetical protein AAFU85_28545 [Planctomycetota bacterium]
MTVRTSEPTALGSLKKSLRPKRENVIAGYAISALSLGACVAVVFTDFFIQDDDGRYFTGALLALAGVGFAIYVRRLSRTSVEIYEHGFVVCRGTSETPFPWSEIASVRERVRKEGFPMKGAAGRVSASVAGNETRSYTVVRKDGREFYFDNNVVPRGSLLAGPLRTAQREHEFAWECDAT